MLFDNENYTERQIEIITKIGYEKRNHLEKEKKKFRLIYFISFVFVIAMGLIAVAYDSSYLTLLILWTIIGSVSYYGVAKKKTKTIDELKARSDYEIGLYYADSDPRVFGVSDKRMKSIKVAIWFMSIIWPLMGLLVGLLTFSEVQPDYTQMEIVTGFIEDGEFNEDYISFILDDENEYRVSSIYTKDIDREVFLNDVRLGDFVTLYVETDNEGRDFLNAYYIEVNGVQYLNEEGMIASWQSNHRLGITLFIVFSSIGLISIISFPLYRKYVYLKNKGKEIFDLGFTKEEMNQIKTQREENIDIVFDNNIEKPYIKTYAPKGFIIFFLTFGLLGMIGAILGLILANEPSDKIPIMIMGLFFSILGWFGFFAIKNEYEILDGDKFYVKRLFKSKEILISEITSITINRQMIFFYDANSKVIAKASTMTKGLAKIVEYMANNGVMLERIIQ